jgi:hypothetical protein
VLGEHTQPSPATTIRWFATAHTSVWRRAGGEWQAWPGSTVHAKHMGSLVTACGARSQTWPKFWHLPFPVMGSDICLPCRDAVRAADPVRSRDPAPPSGA